MNGKSLAYLGHFWNGKRHGMGKYYRNGEVVYDGIWMKGYRKNRIVLGYLIITVMLIIACLLIESLMEYYYGYYDPYNRNYYWYANYSDYLLDGFFIDYFEYIHFNFYVIFISGYIVYWILLLCWNWSILFGRNIVNSDNNIKKLNRLFIWIAIGLICTIVPLCCSIFFTIKYSIFWC